MILSADALEIIAYLKTASGKFFSMAEITRRAAGRQRFEECPGWAKNQMGPLLDEGIVEMNARGHYRLVGKEKSGHPAKPAATVSSHAGRKKARIVGDDYFPEPPRAPQIVGGDYFPSSTE